MRIICCAVVYKDTKVPYKGICTNLDSGELYVASRSHSDTVGYIFKMHPTEELNNDTNKSYGYLLVDDLGKVVFLDRYNASSAENTKYHATKPCTSLYSYEVLWDKRTADDCSLFIKAQDEMIGMMKSKGVEID